jgi:hypothetical protein
VTRPTNVPINIGKWYYARQPPLKATTRQAIPFNVIVVSCRNPPNFSKLGSEPKNQAG